MASMFSVGLMRVNTKFHNIINEILWTSSRQAQQECLIFSSLDVIGKLSLANVNVS